VLRAADASLEIAAPVTNPPLVCRDAAGQRTPDLRAVRGEMGMPP
jgi:hypothetical protein